MLSAEWYFTSAAFEPTKAAKMPLNGCKWPFSLAFSSEMPTEPACDAAQAHDRGPSSAPTAAETGQTLVPHLALQRGGLPLLYPQIAIL